MKKAQLLLSKGYSLFGSNERQRVSWRIAMVSFVGNTGLIRKSLRDFRNKPVRRVLFTAEDNRGMRVINNRLTLITY